jgi:hypothetical protein
MMIVEGILEPRKGASYIVAIDDFPDQGNLYSSVLSIIQTGNALFDHHIRPFRRISFLLTTFQANYQLSMCCAVLSMIPYSYADYDFIARCGDLAVPLLDPRLPRDDRASDGSEPGA